MQNKRIASRGLLRCVAAALNYSIQGISASPLYSIRPRSRWCGGGGAAVRGGPAEGGGKRTSCHGRPKKRTSLGSATGGLVLAFRDGTRLKAAGSAPLRHHSPRERRTAPSKANPFVRVFHGRAPHVAPRPRQQRLAGVSPVCPLLLSHLNKKKHQSRLVGEQSERERRKLAKTPANSFSTPLQLTTCAFFHRPKDTLRAARYAGGRPLMVLYAACRSKATR